MRFHILLQHIPGGNILVHILVEIHQLHLPSLYILVQLVYIAVQAPVGQYVVAGTQIALLNVTHQYVVVGQGRHSVRHLTLHHVHAHCGCASRHVYQCLDALRRHLCVVTFAHYYLTAEHILEFTSLQVAYIQRSCYRTGLVQVERISQYLAGLVCVHIGLHAGHGLFHLFQFFVIQHPHFYHTLFRHKDAVALQHHSEIIERILPDGEYHLQARGVFHQVFYEYNGCVCIAVYHSLCALYQQHLRSLTPNGRFVQVL